MCLIDYDELEGNVQENLLQVLRENLVGGDHYGKLVELRGVQHGTLGRDISVEPPKQDKR